MKQEGAGLQVHRVQLRRHHMLKRRLRPVQRVPGAQEQRLEHLHILMPCLQPVSLSHLLRQTSVTASTPHQKNSQFVVHTSLPTLKAA